MEQNNHIRELKPDDWEAVSKIYEEGIDSHIATFREQVPTWEEWNQSHLQGGRFVSISPNGNVLGFICLSPTSVKEAYAGVCEVSVYVAANARGQGVGRALLQREIQYSESAGIWTLLSLIIEENTSSIKLHENFGFRTVGVREYPAKMGSTGVWHNVVHVERRSKIVGV